MTGGGQGRRIVAVFAITQTVGYGCLYYSFAVLLHPIAADLHASPAAVTGALTTAVLAWAAMAVPVGRWLDRHGGRALMTTGAAAGAGLLAAWSQVHALWQLYLVFAGLGAAMAMSLYDAATAVVVSWFSPDRRARALLAMIVVAGFASTIFMPLTGLLNDRYGWRATLLVLAAGYGAIAVPLHAAVVRCPPSAIAVPLHAAVVRRPPGAIAVPRHRPLRGITELLRAAFVHRRPRGSAVARRPNPARGSVTAGAAERRALVRAAMHDRRFWWLAVAFVAHSAAMSAMTVHLVGFLTGEGHPATFAATVAGLLGVLSVTGRLVLTAAQRRLRLSGVVAVVFTIQAAAALSLPWAGATRPGAIVAVTGFGIGFGVASLATPALLADRYGTTSYASIAGTLAAPVTLAKALAPLGAAALYTATGSYLPVLAAIGGLCLLAAAGIVSHASTPFPSTDPTTAPGPSRASTAVGPSRRRHP